MSCVEVNNKSLFFGMVDVTMMWMHRWFHWYPTFSRNGLAAALAAAARPSVPEKTFGSLRMPILDIIPLVLFSGLRIYQARKAYIHIYIYEYLKEQALLLILEVSWNWGIPVLIQVIGLVLKAMVFGSSSYHLHIISFLIWRFPTSHGGTPSHHPNLNGMFLIVTVHVEVPPMTSWKPSEF